MISCCLVGLPVVFFFQAEDGIRDDLVTGVQTCALPISSAAATSLFAKPSVRTFFVGSSACSVVATANKKAKPKLHIVFMVSSLPINSIRTAFQEHRHRLTDGYRGC